MQSVGGHLVVSHPVNNGIVGGHTFQDPLGSHPVMTKIKHPSLAMSTKAPSHMSNNLLRVGNLLEKSKQVTGSLKSGDGSLNESDTQQLPDHVSF